MDALLLRNGYCSSSMSVVSVSEEISFVLPQIYSRRPSTGHFSSLQYFYNTIFRSTTDVTVASDPCIVHSSDLSLFTDPCRLNKLSFLGTRVSNFGYLTPVLETHCAAVRRMDGLESLLGAVKRNLGVHDLQAEIVVGRMVTMMVKRFFKSYVSEGCRELIGSYFSDKLYPNHSSVADWRDKQLPSLDSAVLVDFDLYEYTINRYSYMLKTKPKPVLDANGCDVYAAPQTIVYHEKNINTLLCPVFKDFKKRLSSVLIDKVVLFSDVSVVGFEEILNSRFSHMIDKFMGMNKLEIDMSKYDKSQGELLLLFELEIYRLFGVPEELLVVWYRAHRNTVLRDRGCDNAYYVDYQKKSGTATTWIGNTLSLMGMVAVLFEISDMNMCLFSGDDSLLVKDGEFTSRESECAYLFNMESKFFRYKFSYFCSKFLLVVNSRFCVLPDLVKILIKFGRRDLVNWEHVEDYRVSCLDLIVPYESAVVDYEVSDAMQERYPGCNSAMVGNVIDYIYNVLQSREEFFQLFYLQDGVILSSDPSRPSLDM